VRHLAEVAAGLHSIVPGESEILGQVRAPLAAAAPAWRGPAAAALATARELRREEAFTGDSGNLLDRGLAAAGLEAHGHLLVIGAGRVGRRVAARGLALGFERVSMAARRPLALTGALDARIEPVSLYGLHSLPAVDVAVGCLGASAAAIELATLPAVASLVLDLGTPPNFTGCTPVRRLTIADLRDNAGKAAGGETERARQRARLHELLDRRLVMAAEDRLSPVGRLRQEVERTRQRESERIARLHPEIPAATIETITRALVNQLFHEPSQRLRRMDADEGRRLVALFEREAPAPEPVVR
jgi:glutamyl-tRNA reductase